jgi:hypothetical protein
VIIGVVAASILGVPFAPAGNSYTDAPTVTISNTANYLRICHDIAPLRASGSS